MENLSISDAPPLQPSLSGGQGPHMTLGRPPLPQQQQQLPPQMFTTAAQLLDLTDKKLLIALRDGRKLIGILRSWDQFANLVLQSTIERIFVHPTKPSADTNPDTDAATPTEQSRGMYADFPHGMFLVRGENVLLLGEIDLDKDDDPPPGYDKTDPEVVKRLAKEGKATAKIKEQERIKKLGTKGFEGENMGEILL